MAFKSGDDFHERHISSGDGLSLFVRDYGAQTAGHTAILCLGGLTRNSKDFHALAVSLSSRFRVITPDYRGRGRSDYDPEWRHYQPRTYLDDIRHIMTALGVHEFAVIGTSLGGVLGMALGTAMPGAVRGVLLNDVGPVVSTSGLEPILAYMRNTSPLPHWESAITLLQNTFPHMPAQTPAEWHIIAEATFRKDGNGQLVFDWDPAIVKPLEQQKASHIDLWPYYNSLRRVPVLAVRGALSSFVDDELWLAMKTAHPGIIQVTVDHVGHAPALNEPAVVPVMEQWLQQCMNESEQDGPERA